MVTESHLQSLALRVVGQLVHAASRTSSMKEFITGEDSTLTIGDVEDVALYVASIGDECVILASELDN